MADLMKRTDVEFFQYEEADRTALRALAPLLERDAEALVQAFYDHLMAFPETKALLENAEVAERLLVQQRLYLLSLAGPEVDEDFVRWRRRIGEIHERVGLEPKWYIGAYSLYLSLLTPLVCEELEDDPTLGKRALVALQKLLLFDMQVAMEHYIQRRERDLQLLNAQLGIASRQLAIDLESTGTALRSTAERAKAAERLASIGVLVAGLAHEIGTPMGVIQGHAKLLESHVDGEDAEWRLRTIQEQIGRISRIIESLLGMARPQRKRLAPVPLGALIESTLAFLAERLDRRKIETDLRLGDVPSVQGDSERLQQVLLNLFMNAADAMSNGGVLRVDLGENDDGEIDLRISDTGDGIAESARARIFDPFVTTKTASEGHGLGLAVAQGIVAEHGGALSLVRSSDAGTEFQIKLPQFHAKNG